MTKRQLVREKQAGKHFLPPPRLHAIPLSRFHSPAFSIDRSAILETFFNISAASSMVQSHATKMDAKESPAPEVSPDLKFEAALAEIERIVQNMESGDLPLEESILAYHRGSELLKHCQKQLGEAERKIRIFENGELRDAGLGAN